MFQKLTVEVSINAPISKVWDYFTSPDQITHWNFASDDWQCPWATNDLRVGGSLKSRMEAKDGSFGFEFEGIYTDIKNHELLEFKMADGRTVSVVFVSLGNATLVTETFDAETQNSLEMQKGGWQSILDNFKKHCEKN